MEIAPEITEPKRRGIVSRVLGGPIAREVTLAGGEEGGRVRGRAKARFCSVYLFA